MVVSTVVVICPESVGWVVSMVVVIRLASVGTCQHC